jgi:hypothetical protein
VGDLRPKAAVPGELVHQRSPLVQLARRGQDEPATACEQPAQESGQPWCGVGRHWRRVGNEVIPPRGGGGSVPHPGIVGTPPKPLESGPDGGLDMEILEGGHIVKLSVIAPVDIPRPWTNFSPVSLI